MCEREGGREESTKKKILFQCAALFFPSSKEWEFEFTLCCQVLWFMRYMSLCRVSMLSITYPNLGKLLSALDVVKFLYISPGFISLVK